MPYNVAVQAYATSGNTDSTTETSTDPVYTLQAPAGLTLSYPSAGTFSTGWTYTPDTDDSLTGFKVWLSNSPVPVWGSAVDVGIPANDAGNPTITFEHNMLESLVGTVYLVVQAYSADATAVSEFASIVVESTLPASVHVDGISESVNRICTGLEVNPIGGTPLLNLNGVAVPTVDNLIAGENITLTKSGRNVTIASSGGGGGGALTPDAISGLVSWYDATQITGLSDGNPVATWSDLSATGNHMTQSDAGKRPVYKASGINSLPAVYINTTSGCGLLGTSSITTTYSIFYVCKSLTSSGLGRIVQGVSNNWLLGPYSGTWQWYYGSGFTTNLGSVTTGQTVVHGLVQTSATGWHFLSHNGITSTFPSVAGEFTYASQASPGSVGQFALGGAGLYPDQPDAYIGEVAVYNRALTYDEGLGLLEHFRDKWGIA